MADIMTGQPQTPASVQKDENGIEVVTDFPEPQFPGQTGHETWAFLDTTSQDSFFVRFRRLVNVNGVNYAEVDYSRYCNGPRKVRWLSLTEFKALKKCQPGDDLRCIRLFGKPFVLAQNGSKSGRVISPKEWDEICRSKHWYPELYNQLVEE
jgi:hypothetical protein